jgi:DNA-binding response OmpR family regulator
LAEVTSTTGGTWPDPDDADELASIWRQARDENLERTLRITASGDALQRGTLSDDARAEALRAAHQLAGAGGTLGYPAVTALAGEAEAVLRPDVPLAAPEGNRLRTLAQHLREEIESSTARRPPDWPGPPGAPSTLPRLLLGAVTRDLAEALITAAFRAQVRLEVAVGLERLVASIGTYQPDALLVESASDSEGIGVMLLLRELRERVPSLPTVVLTLRDDLDERVQLGRAGAHLILRTDQPPDEILRQTRALIGQLFLAVGASIVVVDDDPQMLAVLGRLLEAHGFRVTLLSEPRRFLEMLTDGVPDLVVLDYDMPELDGVDLCRVLRTDMRWQAVPVVFLTSNTESTTIERLFTAGGDDYVTKPVRGRELVARLEYRIARHARPMSASLAVPSHTSLEEAEGGPYPWRFVTALGILLVTLIVLLLVLYVLFSSLPH